MRITMILLALALIALGGCGGDDEVGPTTTVTVEQESNAGAGGSGDASPSDSADDATVGKFIDQADAICEELNARVEGLPSDTLAQIAEAAPIAHEAVAEGLSQLQQLDVPGELEVQFDQFIAAVEDQNAVFQELADAAAAGDQQAAQGLVPDLQRARERKSDIAIQAGFSECGSG